MFVQLLVDNPHSWIVPYVNNLCDVLLQKGIHCKIIHDHEDVVHGDILVLLSCEKKFKKLFLNKHNIVVHESNLPQGRGWSPLTWQILEGKNEIPVTLFEATDDIDGGLIYLKKIIEFDGHELINELREEQGRVTIELVLQYIDEMNNISGIPQTGECTYYPKRSPVDSKLDLEKTLRDQFNLLRVCDNDRYPAWFELNNQKYTVKIFKNGDQH